MRHVAIARPFVLLFTAAIVGCGGGGGDGTGPITPVTPPPGVTTPGTSNSVTVTGASFTPADLTVKASSSVTWTWNSCSGGDGYGAGQTCVAHDVVFDDGATGSGPRSEGSFSRSFATAGTYAYHCAIHGTSMSGRVVVQ